MCAMLTVKRGTHLPGTTRGEIIQGIDCGGIRFGQSNDDDGSETKAPDGQMSEMTR